MRTPETESDLERLLEAADTATAGLLATLEEERDALARRDREAVEALAARKRTGTAELDALGRRLMDTLTALGVGDHAGVAQRLGAMGLSGAAARWATFESRVRSARDLNLANGRVIALGQRSAQRLLDLLRGTDPGARLYDTRGRSRGAAHAGYITKA